MKNSSLEHLSLEGCRVGDRGLEILTSGLKLIPTITSLNFPACGVTTIGAEYLAKLVKVSLCLWDVPLNILPQRIRE